MQTIAEEMKSLKDSTLASSETVHEFQQIIKEPDNMATTEKQQQKISPKNQQADINKLLDTIPSNGIYRSAAGGTFPKGTTDDRANYQKTSTPILGSCGKPVPFSLATDTMSPVKSLDNILHGDSTRFLSASGNMPTMSKQTNLNCDVHQISEDSMSTSSMQKVSVAYSAPIVPFAASTTVGSMAPVAAPSQSTSSKRRKRHRYRSSLSSSDDGDFAPRNTLFVASTGRCHGSRRDRLRSNLNMDIPEFRDLPVNASTEHGNERQRDRSRIKSPNVPKKGHL